ncbi:MAG: cupin [Gammaproteobacteria bacterium]|nr:cupin [Gammaproteobacteria bacterium]|tara:strand:+ start:222 stop:890 length:669 start_codon:yes stop_codon:yes gene_type:complete
MIRTDYSKKEIVNTENEEHHNSPSEGVSRIYLERDDGGEYAVATSIVKFNANSHFTRHTHDRGEEIFVLDGVFSDEFGNYPAGTYIRNPDGSSHSPFSNKGCTIFVKLRQFHDRDKNKIIKNTQTEQWLPGLVDGLSVMPLHQFITEQVALVKWRPHTQFTNHKHFGGEEIFVIKGVFYDEYGVYPQGTWLRSPHESSHAPFTKEEETIIFVKTGHLFQNKS